MRNAMVDFGGYRIHFRDRENEARVFLGEALRYVGIRIIYGPYGAGKTTFLSLINSTLKSLGGEVFIVYMNFEGRALSSILESSLPNGREVVERVRSLLGNVDTLKAGILIAEALKEGITYAISRVKVMEARRLLILIDNLDKYLKEERGDGEYVALSSLLEFFAEAHEHPGEGIWSYFTDKPKVTVFALSDQAAVNVARRLGSKGLTSLFLLWNLPKSAFIEVINEVAALTGKRDINAELLWNLLGGNVRMLEDLVIRHNWNVERWLSGVVSEVNNLIGNVSTLTKLMEYGKGRLSSLGINEQYVGQPDGTGHSETFWGEFPLFRRLLEENILISLVGAEGLSYLPGEPWIGRYYAYQIPAHYWVLRAMIRRGSINVKPEDVLKEIGEIRVD